MTDINWSAVIGTAGGVCSAMSFLPQMLKVRRQGGRDLSMAMLALLLSGAILWLAYGLINQATSVVVKSAMLNVSPPVRPVTLICSTPCVSTVAAPRLILK